MESLKNTLRKSKYEMMDMDKAFQFAFDEAKKRFPLAVVEVNVTDLKPGDVLAEEVLAKDDLPPFRASQQDGYAIKASFAKQGAVCELVKGKSGLAGEASKEMDTLQYKENQIIYVTTGGPVPTFFDTVIPIEETELEGDNIKILKTMREGQFVRPKGVDVKTGQVVLEKNTVLRAAEIGLLATVGNIQGIKVYKKPKFGLISTGNELMPASTLHLEDGKIRDSNKLMLQSVLADYQIASEIVDYGIVRDLGNDLAIILQKATQECDIVLTTGGVSMGEFDLVKPYLAENGQVIFGRINMKPGKPTTFAKLNKALVFALPGNPVSAFVCEHLFVVPVAKILCGHLETYFWQTLNVQLIPKQVKIDERPEYHRAIAIQEIGTSKIYALSTGSQLSSRLLSCSSVNCLVLLPKGKEGELYTCQGQTQAYLIQPIVMKTSAEIKQILEKHAGQVIMSSCCEHHAKHEGSHVHGAQAKQEKLTVSIITVSDRASQGKYETGDLSGKSMQDSIEKYSDFFELKYQKIVPDEIEDIKAALTAHDDVDLILTSGGTGFAMRDITPEATQQVIDRRADCLSQFVIGESVKIVPTACLSRGVIGMRGKQMIVNLPGKPKAVTENIDILMKNKVLLHALNFLKGSQSH